MNDASSSFGGCVPARFGTGSKSVYVLARVVHDVVSLAIVFQVHANGNPRKANKSRAHVWSFCHWDAAVTFSLGRSVPL